MDIFESLNSVLVDLFNDILNIEERALITEEFKDIFYEYDNYLRSNYSYSIIMTSGAILANFFKYLKENNNHFKNIIFHQKLREVHDQQT